MRDSCFFSGGDNTFAAGLIFVYLYEMQVVKFKCSGNICVCKTTLSVQIPFDQSYSQKNVKLHEHPRSVFCMNFVTSNSRLIVEHL